MKEILICDIPEEGLSIEATERDGWLSRAASALAHPVESAAISVRVELVEENIQVDGSVDVVLRVPCDRCLEDFDERIHVDLHTVLAPLYESERQREREKDLEVELVKEDLEFAYYEGDRFDLAEVVRDAIVLAEPIKRLCREDCRGICQRCGANLNEGMCACREETGDPRWAVLKDLKVKASKH